MIKLLGYNKLWIALVGALLIWLEGEFNITTGDAEEWAYRILAVLSAAGVGLVPNKP